MSRIAPTHLILLALTAFVTAFIAWSAVSASTRVDNLVIVVPVAVAIALLVLFILARDALRAGEYGEEAESEDRATMLATLLLLGLFAIFCIALVTVGFDIATFLFVWIGVVLGGERRWWLPPVYSAAFTLVLVWGLGSLFPFPMPMIFAQ